MRGLHRIDFCLADFFCLFLPIFFAYSCLFFLSSSELFEEEREVAELVSEIAPNRFVVGVVGT